MSGNIAAEFALLAGLCTHPEVYFDVAEFLATDDFTQKAHQKFFIVLQRLLMDSDFKTEIIVTEAELLAKASELNINDFYEACDDGELIRACMHHSCTVTDVVQSFKQVKRETVCKVLKTQAREALKYLDETSDGIDTIIGTIEDKLIASNSRLQGVTDNPVIQLPERALQIIEELAEHPGELGLNIGLPTWQRGVGGIRNGAITFVAATTKAGKCTTGDTQIYNPITGYFFTIRDGIKYQNVLSFNGSELVCDKPIAHISNGVRLVYKVETKSGRFIRCTNNHPFLTCVGFKELQELKPGNSIALPYSYPEPYEKVAINDSIASFLGLMIGDGGCTRPVSFTNQDVGVINLFERCTDDLNITHSYRRCGNNTRQYNLHKNCISILQEYGIDQKLSGDKDIRFAYGFANRSIVKLLAAYFDCDGRVKLVRNNAVEISSCSKSEQLSKDVQHLLLRLGIQSRIRSKWNKKYERHYYNVQVITPLSWDRFCEIIGPYMHSAKKEVCQQILERSETQFKKGFYDLIDSKLLLRYLVDSGIASSNHFYCRGSKTELLMKDLAQKGRCGISRDKLEFIKDYLPNDIQNFIFSEDIFYDRIVSIEPDGEEEVFDIEVKDSHNFVANDIIIHNSQLGVRAGLEIAKLGIPVLLCDSELNEVTQSVRAFGQHMEVNYEVWETGAWKLDEDRIRADGYDDTFVHECQMAARNFNNDQVKQAFRGLPLYYHGINGLSARDSLPFLRRWVMQHIGVDRESRVPRCLIIWDYIKLADIAEVRRSGVGAHEILAADCGALHNFAERYNLPILAFGQTNRQLDDSLDCIAGAKKIAELCDSISIYKEKDDVETASDPVGTHLLRVLATRYGRGIKTYVNLEVDLSIGKFTDLGISRPVTVVNNGDDGEEEAVEIGESAS